MANDHQSNALRRLEQLGSDDWDDYRAQTDLYPEFKDGSPGWQMFTSMFLPGIAALRRRPAMALVLLLLGVVAPIALVLWVFYHRDDLVGFALREEFLVALIAVCLGLVIVRLLAIFEISSWYRREPGIGARTFVATVAVLGLAVPVLWAGWQANSARSAVGAVFAGGSDEPLFTPEGGTTDPTATHNVLLLGSDAGPGRWGARTDTMIIVSVHEFSGRTALVSVPRNLVRLQFPPGSPMANTYPDGFTDLANGVFTAVEGNPTLLDAYDINGQQPHAMALAEGIGYSLGIEIDDYALVNMQGFADVIDAVGGVTIDVDSELPMPGGIEGIPPTIGPGQVDMDGNLALGYVRSRSADSDYQRMGRQRQLLAALGSQVSAVDAVQAFGEVTGVLEDSMRTSLSSSEFSDLLNQLGDNNAIGESVGLAPPIIDPGNPDYDEIRSVMAAVNNYVLTGEPSGYAA